jgi:citrate synthase
MLIGKAGPAITSISTADPASITVRGHDLAGDLMGRLTFTEYFHLLVTGREATPDQRYFLDLLLVAIAEHGLVPTVLAARMTYAADPDSLHGAVAAGILGCGTVVLGTAELCGRLLVDVREAAGPNGDPVAVLRERISAIRADGGKVPGFGHPLHKPVDPRAERILDCADERGVAGDYVALARAARGVVADVWGRPMPMNVSMPIAAVLLDLGFPPLMIKAIPILARTAGLIAHLGEEQERPIGFLMASGAAATIRYEPGDAA